MKTADVRLLRTAVLWCCTGIFAAALLLLAGCSDNNDNNVVGTTDTFDCAHCHGDIKTEWTNSPHAATQADVAGELAEERAGETPDEVLHGSDPEDCIACHGATAVLANGGMSETEALGHFFSTENGKFTSRTRAVDTEQWPHVACLTCHEVPDNRPSSSARLALFDSRTAEYTPFDNPSRLCGQCHGNLRFSETDHLTYNAWAGSKHSATQQDVATELAEERAGQTPYEVVNGDDPENCIACHAPTAVLTNGGMTESEALGYFFATGNGRFTANTSAGHTDEWTDVACNACHDQHNPGAPSYFNSTTRRHELMASATDLCGQCHGNLRFPDTDHLSYNIETGTGGIGVTDLKTMPGATCTDCHMYISNVDGSTSSMYHGHSFAITVTEEGGGSTTSCTQCHAEQDTQTAAATIAGFKSDFASLDATAQANVAAAAAALQGVDDADLQAKLAEAQHNLTYAESDESGGFHNHNYLMALLNDANAKALEILGIS